MRKKTQSSGKGRFWAALACSTMLAGVAVPAYAQESGAAQTPAETAPAQPQANLIRSISVVGSQRIEPGTVRSYIDMRVGQPYSDAAADQALKDLYETELFSTVSIRNDNGAVVIQVQENPVINRIILEGNKRLKNDKIMPEIRLAPRQIFTRSKVRADVARIIELYKRQGRFAANVEPKMVQLDQNRVDVVFEISEGPKSKVRQINIIGNEVFSDSALRSEMATKQSRFFRFFSSSDTYDPDRLAFDQQKLRQFYLTEGYADFSVISAVAELTPDKRDFIITYVVEEGERYKFGDVSVDSEIRDFTAEGLQTTLPMESGDWYNAKQVEDTVESLTETAGLFGYAFADVRPEFVRNRDDLTMDITFLVKESPRVYVEYININGNTQTKDKVVRREFRLNEGDAFNSFLVRRSTNRIKSLGFFQEDFEIEQKEGSAPDRIILEANVEERATGQLQLSAGFSSIENLLLQASVQQRNFRGMGQIVSASVNYSSYSKSLELGFTEPYLFDRNIAVGGTVFRRDLDSFNYVNNDRNTTYAQTTTGFQIRGGVPLNEYLSVSARYSLYVDDVTLDQNLFFADLDGDGITTCEPLLAGRFLCDALGQRTTSSLGYSLIYDARDNRVRPSRGQNVVFSQDFAGLGGSVKYLRSRLEAGKYWNLWNSGFIFSARAEGGYILPLENRATAAGVDDVRLTDRFFLGEPQFRGFDIRGVGPRVQRRPLAIDTNGNQIELTDRNQITDDAIGGRAYYLGHLELEIPLGSGASELGLRPSVFVDVGAVFDVTTPTLVTFPDTNGDGILDPIFVPTRDGNGNPLYQVTNAAGEATSESTIDPVTNGTANNPLGSNIAPFNEVFLGNTASPRVSVGIGVNWNSPFGPFRIDLAKALLKEPGDDTKLFTFNVGTQF